ncbi:MAG: DNA-directed RNA polymerase subunit alpha [Bacteroidales bacterium]|jgi:DNA-directed RNA polymerase subunit alpha|nr:DNA-directed RNA polymerase subunit alpha [Bacteroidales bacterium]
MVTIPFQKPEKILMMEVSDSYCVFEFRPLQPGYATTIGNALRRVLISSLEGFAITSIKIEGVPHEFSTIPGVIEDVTNIILNIKQIRLKSKIEDQIDEKLRFTITGKDEFVAGDINSFLNSFQILNTDLHICFMEPNVKLDIELTVNKGRGYVSADDNKSLHGGINVITIDSLHSPVRIVNFRSENYRVEQKIDYDKLIMEITTDGTIHPKEALKLASDILMQHFGIITDDKITITKEEIIVTGEFDEDSLHLRQILKVRLADMDLSVRALNCLKAADVETMGELVAFHKNDLLKFRNFGKKSLNELENLIRSKGLEFGMNISKYKEDKE